MGDPMDVDTWGIPARRVSRTPLMRQRYLPLSARRRANLMFNRMKSRTFSTIQAARKSQAAVRFGGWTNPQSAEIKSVDTSGTYAIDSNSGSTGYLLNGVARGDDISDRIGRSIVMNGLHLKLFGYSTATTGEDQIHRVLVVMDRQANGSAPNIPDILETHDVMSNFNRNNRLRFNVLVDFNVVCGASGKPNNHWYRSIYVNNVRGKLQQFNSGDNGTIADINTNSIYMFLISNKPAGSTAGAVLVKTRFYFKDK